MGLDRAGAEKRAPAKPAFLGGLFPHLGALFRWVSRARRALRRPESRRESFACRLLCHFSTASVVHALQLSRTRGIAENLNTLVMGCTDQTRVYELSWSAAGAASFSVEPLTRNS